MSGLNSARERIRNEWQVLKRQWQTSCDLWRDAVRQRFQREVWQDFERTVPATLEEMKRLSEVIAKARREVP